MRWPLVFSRGKSFNGAPRTTDDACMKDDRAPTRSLLALCLLLALGLAACVSQAPRDPAGVARAYVEAERFDEAAREIELALRQEPSDLELRLTAAEIHALAGHLDQAIGHLEAIQELSPRHTEAAIRLGQLEQERGNPADAYVAFRRAANLAPEDIRAVSGLALTAEALGFDSEATAAYERWEGLEDHPPTSQAP